MTWANYPDRHIAERVCTAKELEVLHMKAKGYGRRLGSACLDISEEAWRKRMRSAMMKIQQAKHVTEVERWNETHDDAISEGADRDDAVKKADEEAA